MRSRSLGARLFAVQLLVLLTGAVTLWLVAALVGPRVFHRHLRHAVPTDLSPGVVFHAEQAFRSAAGLSLAVALATSLVTAGLITLVAARRVAARLASLTDAAADVAGGHYEVRVSGSGLGSEFDDLADAFNGLAGQLEETEATRRRLLADLAHELKTPLATLDAWLEGLADGVVEPDAASIAVLAEQTARMRRLVDDLRSVSRAEERQLDLHVEPVDPAQLVAHAVVAHRDDAQARGVRLLADAPAGLPVVTVDPDRLGEVLSNLVDNALRHTPAGGEVVVAAGRHGDDVALDVSDTGEGIPADALPHVFERFFRVDQARDRASGGSGIGLAIARAITQAHGGRIAAASDGPGTGARFTVLLPAAGSPRP